MESVSEDSFSLSESEEIFHTKSRDYVEDKINNFKVEAQFYSEDFDPMEALWDTLPDDNLEAYLLTAKNKREQEQGIIGGQLSRKVMAHYDAFMVAMENFQKLSDQLRLSKEICSGGKNCMHNAKNNLALGGLQILNYFDRRERHRAVAQVLKDLGEIMYLRKTFHEKIEEGDYYRALDIRTNLTTLISKYPNFTCLSSINTKDYYKNVKKKLKESLASCCCSPFNAEKYRNTVTAYRQIRNVGYLATQLNKLFRIHIVLTTTNTLRSFVLMDPQNLSKTELIQKTKYNSLIIYLTEDSFMNCFKILLGQLVNTMFVHHQMSMETFGGENFFIELARGIENSKKSLWEEIQQISKHLLTKVETFKRSENFLIVIDDLNTFVSVGESFVGGEIAHKLRKELLTISKTFFDTWNKTKLTELHVMLENEVWERTPVRSKFSARDVQEVSKYLGDILIQRDTKNSLNFKQIMQGGNPFQITSGFNQRFEYNEDRRPYEDEIESGVVLASTTINLVRFLGTYISLIDVLPNYMDVVNGIIDAVHLYLWATYLFFGPSSLAIPGMRMSITWKKTFQEFMSKFPNRITQGKQPGQTIEIPYIKLKEGVVILPPVGVPDTTFHGIVPRTVAAESLLFLQSTLQLLKSYLQRVTPKQHGLTSILNTFYTSTVDTIGELRYLLYKELLNRILPADDLIKPLVNVNWNTTKATSNAYMYSISNFLEKRFKTPLLNFLSNTNLPKPVCKAIWDMVVLHIYECLVEGYSLGQCSTAEAREKMLTDFQYLQQLLANQVPEPFPYHHNTFVEGYILSWKVNHSQIAGWFQTNMPIYTNKQLTMLLKDGPWDTKTKQACSKLLNSYHTTNK